MTHPPLSNLPEARQHHHPSYGVRVVRSSESPRRYGWELVRFDVPLQGCVVLARTLVSGPVGFPTLGSPSFFYRKRAEAQQAGLEAGRKVACGLGLNPKNPDHVRLIPA